MSFSLIVEIREDIRRSKELWVLQTPQRELICVHLLKIPCHAYFYVLRYANRHYTIACIHLILLDGRKVNYINIMAGRAGNDPDHVSWTFTCGMVYTWCPR